MEKYVVAALKVLAIVMVVYVLLGAGNGLGSLLVNTIGPHGVALVGPVFGGIAAGCLTALLFGRNGIYLAPVLAAIPILFSWLVRHTHVIRYEYVYRNGHSIPVDGPKPVYAALATMLIVAVAASLVACIICRWVVHREAA